MSARTGLLVVAACAVALSLAARAAGTVSCRVACSKCSANREHFALLEVYCGMCHECRERRRDWVRRAPSRRAADPSGGEFSYEEFEECPTPPACGSEVDEQTSDDGPTPEQLKSTISVATTTTTTTSTSSTTMRKQCPVVRDCMPRKRRPEPCCIPMCPYPPTHPFCTTDMTPQKMTVTVTTPSTTKDYFYVHVGVPKALLNNL